MNCKICKSEMNYIFNKKVLGKYNCKYFQCSSCGFIQTENAYWLRKAYLNPITSTDIGLLHRNLYFADFTEELIRNYFKMGRFLDFAGGYGIFVRLMRDKGFDFYRDDKYCENIFARYFDLTDLKEQNKFELVTAFEVFEHLEDPMKTLDLLFLFSDNILISTELQPSQNTRELENWWYISPETGQHIALFSLTSLNYIAKAYNCYLYSDKGGLHLFTKNRLKSDPFRTRSIAERIYSRLFNKKKAIKSLLQSDSNWIKNNKL